MIIVLLLLIFSVFIFSSMSNTHNIDYLPLDTPADRFLTELKKYKLEETPLKINLFSNYKINEIFITLTPRSDYRSVYLQGFVSDKPKCGEGAAFLSFLTAMADDFDVILALKACPYSTKTTAHPMTLSALKQFYNRYGFVESTHNVMVRKPNIINI